MFQAQFLISFNLGIYLYFIEYLGRSIDVRSHYIWNESKLTMDRASTFGLINGGLAGLFWTYLGTFIGFVAVVASMAEMASMAPTSGGQYHWVSEFAPRSSQRFLSYITGNSHLPF
jgi:amino acid permease